LGKDDITNRLDWEHLFCGLACATMLGIIPAGSSHPWSSWRTTLPITIGGIGWIATAMFEASKFCREPCIPTRLFTNRTSVAVFFMSFVSSIALQWAGFFWPVYSQIRGAIPLNLQSIYCLFCCSCCRWLASQELSCRKLVDTAPCTQLGSPSSF